MPELRPSLLRRIKNSLTSSKRRRDETVDVTADGFVFKYRRNSTEMRWADVTGIDAGVRDFISYDSFYVVLFAGKASVKIEETADGFRQMEFAILERWPQIKERWVQMLSAPLHKAYYEELWRRGGAF